MIEIDLSDDDIHELIAEHNARIMDDHEFWQFDVARRHVIKSWDDVQACPGSGKTTLVAAKLLILAKKWKEPHKGVCVLTHTNVARDEIISRLHDNPSGFKLTSYPHFIGTIQEFVNKYLGLPFCRSNKLPVSRIDDDTCVQVLERNIGYKAKSYLEKKHKSLYDFKLTFDNDEISLCVPGFSKESTSRSYKDLENAKINIVQNGLYFYSEMYSFAYKLLADNPDLIETLRKRFPIVLIDEMQDTQKYQDTLLNQIFDDNNVCLQRLGDPDQAIFDGMGGDEQNESYNSKSDLYEIKTTHRFGLDICEKIIGLSYNSLDKLESVRKPVRGNYPHTVFIYDEATQSHVLDAFGDLIARVDPERRWRTLKAIGGVDGESGQIKKYWSKFDRSKSATAPKPNKFIHIVQLFQDKTVGHVSPSYSLLLQGVVDILRKVDAKTETNDGTETYFSKQSLTRWLRQKEKYVEFRKLLTTWIIEGAPNAEGWIKHVETLKNLLELDELNTAADDYLLYDTEIQGDSEDHRPATNRYICTNGLVIEVGTIHSVKGETHDATLILETKFNRWFDIFEMLPFMLDSTISRPIYTSNSRTKETILAQYMRKLYVAGSRPRHLLCVAIHKDHIIHTQIALLEDAGWMVSKL